MAQTCVVVAAAVSNIYAYNIVKLILLFLCETRAVCDKLRLKIMKSYNIVIIQ